jgi:hypothetical protein
MARKMADRKLASLTDALHLRNASSKWSIDVALSILANLAWISSWCQTKQEGNTEPSTNHVYAIFAVHCLSKKKSFFWFWIQTCFVRKIEVQSFFDMASRYLRCTLMIWDWWILIESDLLVCLLQFRSDIPVIQHYSFIFRSNARVLC